MFQGRKILNSTQEIQEIFLNLELFYMKTTKGLKHEKSL